MYAEAYISLVFGVSRVTWFNFSRWCFMAVVSGLPQSLLGCVFVGDHTQIVFFVLSDAKDVTIQSLGRLN